MEVSPALNEHLVTVIPSLAAQIGQGYERIPVEDLEQGMWEAALERADRLAELLAEGKTWTIRRALRRSAARQIREEQRYQRAKRALARGYAPEDEFFYSTGMIAKLLPLYLDGGVAQWPPRGRNADAVGVTVSRGDEASTNYVALMLDIDYAMSEISPHDRNLLTRYYGYPQGPGGWTHEEISSALGIKPDDCRQRVHRARRAMQRALGGASPWDRHKDGQGPPEGAPLRREAVDAGSGRA